MFNIPMPVQKIAITSEVFDKIQSAAQRVLEEEQRERDYIQAKVDEKFSDIEQSILWRCMNDKQNSCLHRDLNPIVRKHMSSTVPVELYRGITNIEAQKVQDMDVGDTFTLDRVTSFSSDFSVAKQFAGMWHYDSNIILSIRNCTFAYNYQEDMINMLMGAPDSEFGGNLDEERVDRLDMVQGESEFMLPVEARFKIISIDEHSKDPNDLSATIIHLELMDW